MQNIEGRIWPRDSSTLCSVLRIPCSISFALYAAFSLLSPRSTDF